MKYDIKYPESIIKTVSDKHLTKQLTILFIFIHNSIKQQCVQFIAEVMHGKFSVYLPYRVEKYPGIGVLCGENGCEPSISAK
jgi:hypothetical protein